MNFALLFQQLAGYIVASLVTFLATRYHLTADQQGVLTTDIVGAVGFASATAYGLWTNHRAYKMNPGGQNAPQMVSNPGPFGNQSGPRG